MLPSDPRPSQSRILAKTPGVASARPALGHDGQLGRRLPGLSAVVSLLVLATLLALFGGCGYSLVGKTTNIPEDVQAVYIETLVNMTPRQQVEQILTQAIVEELVTRRAFSIVDSVAEADAQLRGKVVSINLRPISFDAQGLADNFEVVITTDMRFERTTQGAETEPEIIWQNGRYIFREDYPIDPSDTVNYLERETEAIEDTADDFARTLVTDLLAGF